MPLSVGICIATHNRRDDLARTLSALTHLEPAPDGLWIAIDGCTDDTLNFVRAAHPQAHLLIHDTAQGSIPSRNALAAACPCDLLLSLDDDSYPVEKDFIARVRTVFAARPRLAVASFPQRSDEFPDSLSTDGTGASHFAGSYANSGAVIRRVVFEQLGGYPGFFFHAYEEPDFALRCAAAGWQVWMESSLTIRHHFTLVQRNELRTHQRHARNEFWSVLLRCPAPQVLGVAMFRAARQFGYAARRGPAWVVREPIWWLAALRGLAECLRHRRPLPWSKYWAWMQLLRSPLQSEIEWNALFGALP